MSAMSDLAYDIEQLYMDDFSPTRIAKILDIPLSMVYDWLQDNQLTPTSFEDWPEDAQQRLIRDVVETQQEDFSPFNTSNS
jgi:hypothetical protein